MKKLLLIFGLVICYNFLIAQTVPLRFATKVTVNNISVFTDPYTVSGTVDDITSNWDASDIQAGDSLYLVDGSNLLVYSVVSISLASGPNFTIVIDDINNTGTLPPLSTGLMIRPTPNKKFTWFTGGVSDYIQTLVANRNAQRLEDAFSNLQADSPVRDTITQTTHGFSRLTPVRQINGTFVNAGANLYPAEAVVVDSIDANTFVIGRTGLFKVPSHGLQVDTTYYLSTTPGQLVTSGNKPANKQQQILTPKSANEVLLHDFPLFVVDTTSGSPPTSNPTQRAYAECSGRTSTVSITDGAIYYVAGWLEVTDPTNSMTANTGFFTAPRDGYYMISASLSLSTSVWGSAGGAEMWISINNNPGGTTFAQLDHFRHNTSQSVNTDRILVGSTVVKLAAGAKVYLGFKNNNSTNVTVGSSSGYNRFSVVELPETY